MSPLLPEAASLKSAIAAINALDGRIAALEKTAAENREALRAIFTVFHPDAGHTSQSAGEIDYDKPQVDPLAQAQGVHRLLMEWIERLGGRLPL